MQNKHFKSNFFNLILILTQMIDTDSNCYYSGLHFCLGHKKLRSI